VVANDVMVALIVGCGSLRLATVSSEEVGSVLVCLAGMWLQSP
jgi:hypothetical protein